MPDARSQGEVRRARRENLYRQQRGKCWLCGKQMSHKAGDPRECTIDHVIPKSLNRDPANTPRLYKAACRECNSKRGASLLECFVEIEGVTALRQEAVRGKVRRSHDS